MNSLGARSFIFVQLVLRHLFRFMPSACLLAAMVAPLSAGEYRTWSDASGKHKITAKLDSVEDGKAVLVRENGSKTKIDLDKLCKEDQEYIEQQKSENPFENAEENPFESSEKESKSTSSGPRTVKVNWAKSDELFLASCDNGWKIPATSIAPSKFRPKTVILPARQDFFEGISQMAVSHSGKSAVVGYEWKKHGNGNSTSRLVLCNLETGNVSGSTLVETEMIPLAIHDDGQQILMRRNEFGHGKGDRMELWSLKGKKLSRSLIWTPFTESWAPSNDVCWAEFLPDNKAALCSSGGKLAIWDLSTGQPICHIQGKDGMKPAISPDQKWIVFADKEGLGLLDVEKRSIAAVTDISDLPHASMFAFSPSGKSIACQGVNRILAWNAATGKQEIDFTMEGIHAGNELAFPDDGFLLVGNTYLIDLQNHLKVWHYRGPNLAQSVGGMTYFALANDQKSGALVAAKVPHPEALALLKKALAQSDLFVFQKGTPVKLDVSGIPDPTEQAKAQESLTKKLSAMNCPIKPDAKIEIVANVEGPKSREISYMHSGTYQVQEYFTKLNISYEGQSLWQSNSTNIPGMLSLKQGENIETKLREASQGPNYKFYENVSLPSFLQKPSAGNKAGPQNGQTIGQSDVTARGIK
jgi:WD40 repeat protein